MSTSSPGLVRVFRVTLVAALASAAALASCGDDPPPSARARGPSDFTTSLPAGGGNNEGSGGPAIGGGPGPSIPRDTPPFWSAGPFAHVAGPLLVSMNEYRGLQIVDVAATPPQLLARVPMPGRPVALYIDGTAVFALVDDADGQTASGARVHAVDLADPRAPRVAAVVDLPGNLVAARLRGRLLDVVSRARVDAAATPGTALVSVDLTDLRAPVMRGRIDLPGPEWTDQALFTDGAVYLALYGARRWVNGACIAAPPVGEPGTTLPQGCTRIAAVDLAATSPQAAVVASVELRGRVAPGGLDLHAGALRVVREGWATGKQPREEHPPGLLSFRAAGAAELAPLGAADLAFPAGGNDVPLFRFAGARVHVATNEGRAALVSYEAGAGGPPVLAGQTASTAISGLVAATADRLLAVETHLGPDQCPVTELVVRDMRAHALGMLSRQLLAPGAQPPAALLPGGLAVVSTSEPSAFPELSSRAGLRMFEVDLDAGTLAPRGHTLLSGSRTPQVLAAGDGKLLALSSERLDVVDARDRDRPAMTGTVEVARWVEDVKFAGGHALTLVSDHTQNRVFLHLSAAGDPDPARPLATLAFEGQSGRLFVHDRFAYLFWQASSRVGRADPRLEVIEVAGGTLRVRSSRSLAGPASLPLGPENDGDGAAGQGLRQVAGTTFVAPLSRVHSCEPMGGGGGGGSMGSSSPGSAGRCAPQLAPVAPIPLPPAPAIDDAPGVGDARRLLDGNCPGSGADLVVVDASDPEAPKIASLLRLPGTGELGASVVQGNDLFVQQNEFSPAPGPEIRGARSVRQYVVQVGLADPASPVVGPRVNVPGTFVAARAGSEQWFTALPTFDAQGSSAGLTVVALYHPRGSARAYEEARLVIEGSASGPVVEGDALFATVNGALVAVDLAAAGGPQLVSRTPVPGATTSGNFWAAAGPAITTSATPPVVTQVGADIHRVVGRHAFVMLGGRAMRVFDVRDAGAPRLLDQVVISPRGAHPVRLAPGNRAIVPRAEWGAEVIALD
jgi:hypothetical protein